MLPVGFEPTIPVFEGAKTVHASDRAATVIGLFVKLGQVVDASISSGSLLILRTPSV
jgi:hypothetical protein